MCNKTLESSNRMNRIGSLARRPPNVAFLGRGDGRRVTGGRVTWGDIYGGHTSRRVLIIIHMESNIDTES